MVLLVGDGVVLVGGGVVLMGGGAWVNIFKMNLTFKWTRITNSFLFLM